MPIAYWKTSLSLMLIAGLRVVLAPVLSTVTLVVSTQLTDVDFSEGYVALALVSALLCALFTSREPQRESFFPSGLTLAGQIGLAWLAVAGSLLLIGYVTKTSHIFSRRALLLWFVATPPLLVAAFLTLRFWLRQTLVSATHARRAVIVGVNKMSQELARKLHERPELGLKVCGFFEDRSAGRIAAALDQSRGPDCKIISNLVAIERYVKDKHIEVVFIALPYQLARTRAVLDALRDTTSSVYLIPDISVFDLIQARSDEIQGVPVIALCESPLYGLRGASKRLTDILFGSLLLLAAAPVMLACAVAIKLTSPGRVIFKQDRYGLDGEKITVYKFRTMTVCENGDRIRQARRGDSRVTPVGRFLRRTSLDELPQLINVIQGRMSLVGPRPHAVAHNEEYRKLISGYMVRHKVAPGMTGLAQINGCRGETATLEDMKRRVKYDLEYLRHWCWLLDIKIMLKTFVVIFKSDHAY